jgi:DivIVA domain-containing protein
MSDNAARDDRDASPFDELMQAAPAAEAAGFTTAFRGYDRDEVDRAIATLRQRLETETARIADLEEQQRSEAEAARAESEAAIAATRDELASAREDAERAQAELTAANARVSEAEQQVQTLTEELRGGEGETAGRHRFDEVLQVAEEQAAQLITNATRQADRLLEAARAEIENRKKDAEADAGGIRSAAEHDAQQARLRIDTEVTAHESRLEREAAAAAEKVAQAEQEAAAIRTEAEKQAAALRALVSRETAVARSEAEEAVRELRTRALEFEESLTRRQDDAQQEFLVLHNQAVAHAERITQDANEQVAASLEHAQRVAARADDFDRLMRAQAAQIEADANVRAREHLDRAREKAQRIIDTVTTHSQAVVRDAEDRTRQLRWQQHQLTSFMSEVRELIRADGTLPAAISEGDGSDETPKDEVSTSTEKSVEIDDADATRDED